jgi:P-type Ca2+ transporter type 2C
MHQGLSETQASQCLTWDGPNELPVSRPRGVLRLLRDVVLEPMFLLLVACGAIYMALGDRHEALMLLGFVLVVMGITFVQRRRSECSLEALRDLSSPWALVVRDGQMRRIAGRELVCGDVVLLAEGDRVPGDMLLFESSNLAVDESLLTGESAPVTKQAAPLPDGSDSTDGASPAPGDRNPAHVFSGTLVTRGTARGLVLATGERKSAGPQHPGGRVAGGQDRVVRGQDRDSHGQPHGGSPDVVRVRRT